MEGNGTIRHTLAIQSGGFLRAGPAEPSDSLFWNPHANPEGGITSLREHVLVLPPQECQPGPSCTWVCLIPPGHVMTPGPSCLPPPGPAQLHDLTLNLLSQLLSPNGQGRPDSILDKVTGFSRIPRAVLPLPCASSEWEENPNKS